MTSLLCFLVATQSPTAGYRQPLSMLQGRYAAYNKAILAMSLPQFKTWLTDNLSKDFFVRGPDGTINGGSSMFNTMRDEFLVLKSVKSSTTKLGNISIHPDHISCSVTTHFDGTSKDNRRYVEDSLAVDVWRQTNHKWNLASIVTTKDRLKVNGKVVRSLGISQGEAFP